MSWQPLLEGSLRDRALECIETIAADLASPTCALLDDPSLAGGKAGQAILHRYHASSTQNPQWEALAERCLRDATNAAIRSPLPASLYAGLAGIGWAIAHLQNRSSHPERDEELAEIDDAMLQYLDQSPWVEGYDLIDGLVGLGVYALERLPRPAAVACLRRVIRHLDALAEPHDNGLRWWTNPRWLALPSRVEFPHGYYNLGLAHGVPGVIALLGLACAAGVESDTAGRLLEGAVHWLMAHDTPRGFGYWVEPGSTLPAAGRLAWCYGDPGVAAALCCAARSIDARAWERRAVAIALRAASRPSETSGVVDASLCHGTAGLGHVFNRLYQATGIMVLGEAAQSWFERTLAMRRPHHGIGGFEACSMGDNSERAWSADPGLLTGATGIALALLGASTDIEPAWDRLLLVATPSPP